MSLNLMRISLPGFILLFTLVACSDGDDVVNLGVATSCDAAISPCDVKLDNYRLKLLFTPAVKPLQPFVVELQLSGKNIEPKNVIMDFIMVGMDMGMNRYRLNKSDDTWKGRAILPVCTASRTDWVANVEFMDKGKKYVVAFPFHTDAN